MSESSISCSIPHSATSVIRLGHGSGGKMTSDLIENVFLPLIGNDVLNQLEDASLVPFGDSSIAITTDSYVVSPIFFPGGDIGSLAVHGTVNDLAMRGATPLAISSAFILEEGLPIEQLSAIVNSMKQAAANVGIAIVAADTKVVGRGAADKLFITTTGIGLVNSGAVPSVKRARPGNKIIISGDIGRHGIAVMAAREGLDLETALLSDSAPLHSIVRQMLEAVPDIHCLRDITRGGLSGVLNEIAQASHVGIAIEESQIPLHPEVYAICELLGLDPMYVACEGRFVAVVQAGDADRLVALMKRHPLGADSRIIGEVTSDHQGRVVLRSRIGGRRIVDKLSGEQLPRIC
jgi:hydrogenase expression/formation protein HypE